MKQYLNTIICSTAMTCMALLAGCTKDLIEESDKPGDGKTITALFTLSPEAVEEIDVRSIAGVDERLIKDLWVIQLNAAGSAQLQDPQYITTGFTSTATDYKVSIPLKREVSKIYFITNTHSPSAYTGKTTTATVEAVTKEITAEADLASADGIPMAGVWTGTPDLLGIAGRVSLSRAVAKVNFNLNALLPHGENFTLESVTVKQVPKALNYYRDATTLDTYPYPTTPATFDYPATVYDKELTTLPESMWWYLPENARGKGSATIQTDKASKFPIDQKAYCTYIEIIGKYILSTGLIYKTTYSIYLGGNNTDDYNIKRNTAYNVTTTIKGIDAADTRINIVEVAPLDYTDNGSAWFLIAPGRTLSPADNSLTMNWYMANGIYDATNNPYTLSACPKDWRLPTHMEASLIWIYNNASPNIAQITKSLYWTSSDINSNNAWRYDLSSGFAYSAKIFKTELYRVRCVKNAPTSGSKYPYVGTNKAGEARVIVSRDTNGGVGSNAIRTTNWTGQTPSHIYSDVTLNNVPARLEVATTNCNTTNAPGIPITLDTKLYIFEDAIKACTAYTESGTTAGTWRLPTQRELKLIWTMQAKGELSYTLTANSYWTATGFTLGGSVACVLSGSTGSADNQTKSTGQYVRCVRDITP